MHMQNNSVYLSTKGYDMDMILQRRMHAIEN